MPDERTGSVMTRIGTALRGSLKPERIVEIVQCRQFFQRLDEKVCRSLCILGAFISLLSI